MMMSNNSLHSSSTLLAASSPCDSTAEVTDIETDDLGEDDLDLNSYSEEPFEESKNSEKFQTILKNSSGLNRESKKSHQIFFIKKKSINKNFFLIF
jgi:hypothetical protein